MHQVIEDAGHNKFIRTQILMIESNILETLTFKVFYENIYDEASLLFKDLIYSHRKSCLLKADIDIAQDYLLFICQISVYSLEMCLFPVKIFSLVVVKQTLKFLSRRFKYNIAIEKNDYLKDDMCKSKHTITDIKEMFQIRDLEYKSI